MAEDLPSTIRRWEYFTTTGGLEKNLKLNKSAALPTPKADQHLVKILAVGLNPVDYKPAEHPIINRLLVPKPATPGIDICASIVKPALGSDLKPGQRIVGAASEQIFAAGGLAEYVAVPTKLVVALPDSIGSLDAAAMPVAALTAWQSIIPHIKAGTRVFINGGSGGVGTFGIQLAKAHGADVTVSCSTPNIELCKSLGADLVVDYKKAPITEQLREIAKSTRPFDLFVDNVGSDFDLYYQAHEYTIQDAKYISIASSLTLSYLWKRLKVAVVPGFLGGGKREFQGMLCKPDSEQMSKIIEMMVEGRLKAVVDGVYPMEQAADAYRRLKTERARGKIIVEVSKDEA